MKEKKAKRRKLLSATLAIAMVLTMLLSGTLAYFYQSRATNEFRGLSKDAVGHDDFVEGVNKDVYVENAGHTDIYVRVRLSEKFELNGTMLTENTETDELLKDKHVHIPSQAATAENPDVDKVTVGTATPDTDAAGDIHAYFPWTMGNTDERYYLKAAGIRANSGRTIFMDNGVARDNSGVTYTEAQATADSETYGTIPACTVISMAKYMLKTEEEKWAFVGWVIDSDGWAYWSQMVKPGQATGLLLDNVEVKGLSNADYQYDIDVEFEAVDEQDISIWTDRQKTDADGNQINGGAGLNPVTDSAATLLNSANMAAVKNEYTALKAEVEAMKADDQGISGSLDYIYDQIIFHCSRIEAWKNNLWNNYQPRVYTIDRLLQIAEEIKQTVQENPNLKDEIIITNQDDAELIKDVAIRAYLFDNYANLDGVAGSLSAEDVLGIISLSVSGVSDLTNVSTDTFPNLISVGLTAGTFTSGEAPENLNLKRFSGIMDFGLTNCRQITEIDFGPVANSLVSCNLHNVPVTSVDFSMLHELTYTDLGDLQIAKGGLKLSPYSDLYTLNLRNLNGEEPVFDADHPLDLRPYKNLVGTLLANTHKTGKLDTSACKYLLAYEVRTVGKEKGAEVHCDVTHNRYVTFSHPDDGVVVDGR